MGELNEVVYRESAITGAIEEKLKAAIRKWQDRDFSGALTSLVQAKNLMDSLIDLRLAFPRGVKE